MVHPAELDVADDVVEGLEEPLRRTGALEVAGSLRDVARQIGTAVARPVDERVPRLTVGGDGREAHRAVLVALVVGLDEHCRAGPPGLRDAAVDVGHLEGDVDDPVAVGGLVCDERTVGVDGALKDEPDRPRAQHERLVIAVAVLGPGVGLELHTPRGLVVVRGLRGVADDEDDRVPARHREGVGALVVVDEAHELAQLAVVEVGHPLGRGELGVLTGGQVGDVAGLQIRHVASVTVVRPGDKNSVAGGPFCTYCAPDRRIHGTS